MSYLDDDSSWIRPGSITRVHFDTEAVPFSGDWKTVARVTVDGLYIYTYELRDGRWQGGDNGVASQKMRRAVEASWSKHLADIMMRDEDGTADNSEVLQGRVQASVR